ncbi:LysM peptidoglycan-binding domain-containing protein [Psychroserpens sp. XS_ASV72]|uniref:LysM peptidoglycan-binding domain-containing protein n=1 Tax=Psychroserpens sp. XS_ASV72 TaxID=3241293 RepID=UPI003516FBD9
MLKNFRLIAVCLVVMTSSLELMAQTEEYKDVLLNGKPAKLNLVTGEVTYTNGEVATSRAAKKIKDSLLDTRTVIKTNLIVDMADDPTDSNEVPADSTYVKVTHEAEQISPSPKAVVQKNSALVKSDIKHSQIEDEINDKSNTSSVDYHIVKKGETLYSLSKRYNISVGKLLIANNLDTTIIKVGQKLQIGTESTPDSNTIWTVSKGDTLFSIAKENNTTVNDIKDLNGLTSNVIKIGQKLQLNKNSIITKK